MYLQSESRYLTVEYLVRLKHPFYQLREPLTQRLCYYFPTIEIGIDTPEVYPQTKYYGPEAWAKNRELVEGKVVTLEKDVTEADAYGRLLRYVYVDGVFVNGELVRLGYARAIAYPPDTKYQERLAQLEEEARGAGRGLWR